jgi:fumarate hydratase subunit alpha
VNTIKQIHVNQVIEAVKNICIEANYVLPTDVMNTLEKAAMSEPFKPAAGILNRIVENHRLSAKGVFPICQDTGMAFVMVELGQDVHIEGGSLEEAIHEGVRQGYGQGFLRKSVVKDPLKRTNTGDNSPAAIQWLVAPGDELRIVVAPKGFGSENMSRLKMLMPSDGLKGVEEFVIETIELAGSNPCPPIVVGIGIGGTFDLVANLAKRALLRPFDEPHPDPFYQELESDLLDKINATGIGPQGFGGKTTALAVKIEAYPTHIAGLPVAVNINCHAARHVEIIL